MIDTHDFARLVAWRGNLQAEGQGKIALLGAALLIALMIAFVAAAPVSAHHDSPGSMSLSAYVAANPELSIVHRYLLADAASDSATLWDDLQAYDMNGLYRYGD